MDTSYVARKLVDLIDQTTPYHWTQPTLRERLERRRASSSDLAKMLVVTVALVIGLAVSLSYGY